VQVIGGNEQMVRERRLSSEAYRNQRERWPVFLLFLLLLLTACTLPIQPPVPDTNLYAPPAPDDTLAGIGPNQPYTAAPCNRTLDPGANIQDAIDAVRDQATPYVLCLNPGY
jgi:hypothetical protein